MSLGRVNFVKDGDTRKYLMALLTGAPTPGISTIKDMETYKFLSAFTMRSNGISCGIPSPSHIVDENVRNICEYLIANL